MQKLGLSRSVPKEPESIRPEERRKKQIPKIGDIKKDKLKNSLAMTNDEKDKAVAREKEISRNRGICMVS